MNTTPNSASNQAVALSITGSTPGMLSIPSGLKGFKQTLLTVERVSRNEGSKQKPRIHRTLKFRFAGFCDSSNEPKTCPSCGAPLLRNGSFSTDLRYIPMGGNYSVVKARRDRFRCSNPECKYCKTAEIDFKSKGHLITEPLRVYAEKQLALGLTLKQVAHLTGLHKDVVKDIDKTRLEKLYTAEGEDGKRTLIKARNAGPVSRHRRVQAARRIPHRHADNGHGNGVHSVASGRQKEKGGVL